jgi:hypothetical protein
MAVSIGYDEINCILEIEFRTGEVWQYHDVAESIYYELISGSIGKYFQSHIKGQYPESRVK